MHPHVQSWYVAKVKEAVAGFAVSKFGSFGHWKNWDAHADAVHRSGEFAMKVYACMPFSHCPTLQQWHVQSW